MGPICCSPKRAANNLKTLKLMAILALTMEIESALSPRHQKDCIEAVINVVHAQQEVW